MSLYERSALLAAHRSSTPEPRSTKAPSSNEWSSSYSSNSSLYPSDDDDNSDDSYTPDWDRFVQDDGNLFYIEYEPTAAAAAPNKPKISQDNNFNKFNRASTRRSKKSGNKLSKLMNRNLRPTKLKNAGASTSAGATAVTVSVTDNTKVKFSEITEGEIKEIMVFIDPAMRHKFGRRTSAAEAILGVSICPFPDGKRLMVAGYMPNSRLGQDKFAKVGDWLKAVNDVEVTAETLDLLLESFGHPMEVKLTLQRMSGEQRILADPMENHKITSVKNLVDNMDEVFPPSPLDIVGADEPMRFSVMYLTMAGLCDNGAEGQDVIFCYPPKESNALYSCRGSFLTLNSLLRTLYKSAPLSSTVNCLGIDYHIVYKDFEDDLLLVAISSRHSSQLESQLKANEVIRCIELLQQTVPRAFANRSDQTWSLLFAISAHLYGTGPRPARFEQAMSQPHFVPLPKEAQLRIDDALSEMEAMDYREWNSEPLKSHREFYIVGSALYYRSYLLASHLPTADLIDVECFLRAHGIGRVMDAHAVRDLVVWQEIYPKSVQRGLAVDDEEYPYAIPKGRWFLALVARSHMVLAVVLESRHVEGTLLGSSERLCITPSPFYIEEIQDTFEHLKSGGIENLASTWIQSGKRPQVIKKSVDSGPTTLGTSVAAAVSSGKKTEIISILKRRNNSSENVGVSPADGGAAKSMLTGTTTTTTSTSVGGGSSVNSQTLSEDSNHEESDSDWDGFPDSQRSSSGFDMSDVTETLLREVSDVIPSKITAGNENVLLHYVQLEVGHGYVLAPTMVNERDAVVQEFRKACQLIHTILQNTIRFRNMLAQESGKPNSHRSLVAIKEHGVLITVDTSNGPIEFWVIGRLFTSPPMELYVCHRSDVPQNLIEMAFRLSLNSAG